MKRQSRATSSSANSGDCNYHQLIFIGNGFDLACGLPSKYENFFDERLEVIEAINTDNQDDWERVVADNGLTIWDFILMESSGSDWCNVEKAISEWVVYRDNIQYSKSLMGLVESVVNQLPFVKMDDKHFQERIDSRFYEEGQEKRYMHSIEIDDIVFYLASNGKIQYEQECSTIIFSDANSKALEISKRHIPRGYALHTAHKGTVFLKASEIDLIISLSRYLHYKRNRSVAPYDKKSILSVLRSDLAIVEAKFKEYLEVRVNSNTNYHDRANELLMQLVQDGSLSGSGNQNDTSVISFNYTMPFSISDTNHIADFINIHGSLDKDIIFGIDGMGYMDKLEVLPFTKTYRVALMGIQVPRNFVRTAVPTDPSKATRTIKFFGHSLSEADYSYFQAAFDGVNLYSSSTKLVFYYRPWSGKDEDKLRSETVQKVTRLLTTYGETLDNKDHGKNLMHKLMLEGRLQVKKI